ncbi:MAG: hypothetical protein KGL39_02780 [Patescibacteria group bacterium]|nr:hypothetical protein [Patescibacteria group bacterium]
MMNLKNYTSGIPANTTIGYVEAYLMQVGATGISKKIEAGQVVAIVFEIPDEDGELRLIKLPANVAGVQEYLWQDYISGARRPRKTKEDFADQAARTAWKIMQDWVQVQMSMIKLKQMKVLQVFLPYVWDGQRTYYEFLKGQNFKSLPAPRGDSE